jgi:hypothetical protein
MTFPVELTSPGAQAGAPVVVNENFSALGHQAVYSKRYQATTGLTWAYHGGRWSGFAVADGTHTLTNTADNYIVAQRSDGVPSVSTSTTNWNDTTDYARVYKITVAGGVVTAVEDHRAGLYGVHGNATSPSAVGDVVGPASATDNAIALFDLTTGKLLRDSATIIDTDDTLAADSDTRIPTQQAVKAYVDNEIAGATGDVATDAIWDAAGDLAVGTGANTAAKLTMGSALQVLRVNAAGTALEYAAPTGVSDADDVTYTPTTLADWDGGSDPGDVEQALDQLAERVTDLEGAGGGSGSPIFSLTAFDSAATISNSMTPYTLANGLPVLWAEGGSTNEAARFLVQFDDGIDLSGGVDIIILCTMASATSGNVRFGARFMRLSADISADSFDTAVEAHVAVAADIDDITTVTLSAVPVDGAAAGDQVWLEVYRDASDTTNDTATGAAFIHSIQGRV